MTPTPVSSRGLSSGISQSIKRVARAEKASGPIAVPIVSHLPAPHARRDAILALKAAVERLLRVKAQGNRHVKDRLFAAAQALGGFLQLLRANVLPQVVAGMLLEDPLQVPLRVPGPLGNGIDVEAAVQVVVYPAE